METRFPISRDAGHIPIAFTWCAPLALLVPLPPTCCRHNGLKTAVPTFCSRQPSDPASSSTCLHAWAFK
jgi:hypothetical protein